jgi:hypothetical protein
MALIKYDRNTALGSMVSSVVNGAIQMKFLSTRLKDVMDSAIVAEDYGPVETLFGLDVGQGQEFYVTVSKISDVISKIPGLSKLDQG